MTESPPRPTRRNDLDWLRIGAFGLLIVYHVGLVYGPYDWHIQSVHEFDWIREAVLITNPWRLTLLFLVSGAAVRFMSAGRTAGQVARSRFERLVPPFLFGVLVLVTIQSWIEALDKGGWTGGYLQWLWHEFSPVGLMDGVPINHLWFVLYVGVYSLLACALLMRPGGLSAMEAGLARLVPGWWILVVPALYLILARVLLYPTFGITNTLPTDLYNHVQSFGAFLFGFLLAGRDQVWRDLERFRWFGLAFAVVALPVMMLQEAHPGGGAYWGVPRNALVAAYQWAVLSSLLGFSSRLLRGAGGPTLSYLREAVFPCYLAHQTILVAAVWFIRPANLPAWLEAGALVVITLGGSLLVYEIVRRIGWMRSVWGLRPLRSATSGQGPSGRDPVRLLLVLAIVAPLLAVATVGAALAANPGFDHAGQYISELGAGPATFPAIFNVGVIIAGVLAIGGGLGMGLALDRICGARKRGLLLALVFLVAGAGLILSGIYPWPDDRHMYINLALGIQLAPLLLLWGLSSRRDMPGLKGVLVVSTVVMIVLLLFTKHLVLPGTVNDANVGWWERAYAVTLVGWIAVAALLLDQRLRPAENPARRTAD